MSGLSGPRIPSTILITLIKKKKITIFLLRSIFYVDFYCINIMPCFVRRSGYSMSKQRVSDTENITQRQKKKKKK